MDCLTFLNSAKAKVQPLYVVHGDDDFLKRLALRRIRQLALGDDADDFSLSTYPGDKADFATAMDDLQTVPFFSPRRLVVVEAADPFVTKYREKLEKSLKDLPPSGTLVLEVKTWTKTTRLAKAVDAAATIDCKAPTSQKLPAWCVDWAKSRHDKQLKSSAAQLLVELIGQEMGQLDQELLKLSVYVGDRKQITDEDVDRLVGRSQAENTWKIFDAIGLGDAKGALEILHRLFDQGEEPLRIVGAFSMKLRQLAQAGRLAMQGMSMSAALEQAGVQPYFAGAAQQQLRHLGRARVARLYDWLLQINLDLRGGSPLPPRTLLERLVVRLAQKVPPPGK